MQKKMRIFAFGTIMAKCSRSDAPSPAQKFSPALLSMLSRPIAEPRLCQ